ncbi:MAG TPA: VOC family protein [Candidatus Tumulicola sp.]|nr:VOC family protein [Candidatus Tumulicola sp.]
MPIHAIDHVQLAMPGGQEDAARAFYIGMLGFSEMPKPAELAARGGVWFRSGNVALHLGVDAEFRPAAKAHPAFACTDYGALLERLNANGVPANGGGTFQGKPHCYVFDPFGNRLELVAEA